ncbi:MAG: hypothetical protein RSB02_06340, partial [Anaerovoracaceae bacterium]
EKSAHWDTIFCDSVSKFRFYFFPSIFAGFGQGFGGNCRRWSRFWWKLPALVKVLATTNILF